MSNNTATVDGLNNMRCNKSDKCDQVKKFNTCLTAAYIPGKKA